MKKIMIVEDDKVIRNKLFKLLANADYLPVMVTNFKNEKIDIIYENLDLVKVKRLMTCNIF